jgi:3-oxoadipate enol-lactonase
VPFFDTADLKVYYEVSEPKNREAPRVLFIGGTGGDLRVKPNIMDGPVAEAFNLITYDQRGLGRTKGPDGPFTMVDYADDALAVLDHLGWTSAHVYGVSFGGMVAQHLVGRHPERVDKLVLACTSSGGKGGSSYPLHALTDLDPKERFVHMLGVSDIRYDLDWQKANPKQLEKMWAFNIKQNAGIEVTPSGERGKVWQIDARKDHNAFDALSKITSQTFICGGKFDGLSPPANLEVLHAEIPVSKLKFYEGGHLFMLQDPQAVKDVVTFLKDQA